VERYEALWNYQTADMALAEFENKLKDTPTRKKMVKLHRFLQAAQAKLAEMENTIKLKHDSISGLENQNKKLEADMHDLNQDIGYYSECDVDELSEKDLHELVLNCEKTYDAIVANKKQVSQIKAETEQTDKEIRELVAKMKAATVEYNELKKQHDVEKNAGGDEQKELAAAVAEAEKHVEPALLSEYKRIKGFRTNPVAVLENDRCTGCRMQLPSGVKSQVMGAGKIIECENCGRILIIK